MTTARRARGFGHLFSGCLAPGRRGATQDGGCGTVRTILAADLAPAASPALPCRRDLRREVRTAGADLIGEYAHAHAACPATAATCMAAAAAIGATSAVCATGTRAARTTQAAGLAGAAGAAESPITATQHHDRGVADCERSRLHREYRDAAAARAPTSARQRRTASARAATAAAVTEAVGPGVASTRATATATTAAVFTRRARVAGETRPTRRAE